MKKFIVIFFLTFLFINLNAVNYHKKTIKDAKTGKLIDEIIVPGVPENQRISGPIATPTRSSVILNNVPAFNWSFGCSATSAAMMAGYYDNIGYPANYKGPTNNGVMPLDNSSWEDWYDGYSNRHQCPLSATHNNLDGRTSDGHVDRFWKKYGNSAEDGENYADSFTGDPTETYEFCTADYMGTNQDWWHNSDGSTTFYYNTDGSPLVNYSGSESGDNRRRDGNHGLRLFFEARGYNVVTNYNQYIEESGHTYGFTFQQFEDEINSGRPLFIQVSGHTMLGIGYDPADSTVYLHDTWDYNTHSMKWGESYSGMQHYGVSVLQLEPIQTTISPVFSPVGGTYTSAQDIEISLTSEPSSGITTIRYTDNNEDPTENSNLYTSLINIPLETFVTLKAKAYNTLWEASDISTADYIITGKVATPTISPDSGTYYSSQICSISCANPSETEIYYTIDNSNPSVGSENTFLYSEPFQINSDTIVKAMAIKTDWENSDIASNNYIINPGIASNPSPIDGETDLYLDTTLSWENGSNTETVDLYFSTDESLVSNGDISVKVIDNQNISNYSPTLNYTTTYYWRVDCKNSGSAKHITPGNVWSFTTMINPNYGESNGYFFANSTDDASDSASQPVYDWIDISTTGTSILNDFDNDSVSGPYEIGFTFNYYGVNYTQLYISSNGWISLGGTSPETPAYNNDSIPTTDIPNNILAWFWDDLDPTDSDSPNRNVLFGNDDFGNRVITFSEYPQNGASSVDDCITAQVILYSNGNIKYQYQSIGSTFDINSASVGIENADGTLGVAYRYNTTIFGPLEDNTNGGYLALAFGTDETKLNEIPVSSLESPVVTIEESDGNIILSWDAVSNAASYKIETCDIPDGTYSQIAWIDGLTWTDTNPGDKKFYRVVADTDAVNSKRGVSKIRGKNFEIITSHKDKK